MGERDERLDAIYNHPNIAKHMHTGYNTKTRYGFLGGGRIIPGGVFKADIRMRPDLYICANCRSSFTVTRTEVYCPSCSGVQLESLRQGKPSQPARPMPQIVKEPEELPPPPDLTGPQPELKETYLNEMMLDIPRWLYLRGILEDAGVLTVEDVQAHGHDGLVEISGIGAKTADMILSAIEAA